jgi:hypothetical protein
MRCAIAEGNQYDLHPMPHQSEKIACANLAVGCLEYAIEASIVVARRLRVKHVPQGFFEGIAHGYLANGLI